MRPCVLVLLAFGLGCESAVPAPGVVPSKEHAMASTPPTPEPPADPRVDLTLFMPEDVFQELHAQALRLQLSDSALLTGCWYAARSRLLTDPTAPKLTASRSSRVYFNVQQSLDLEVAKISAEQDRSKSWLLIKAWLMAKPTIQALPPDAELFHRWARELKQAAP